MCQVKATMIAFHGKPKPKPLEELLRYVLGMITSHLPSSLLWSFVSYTFYQMHGTIIGMEADIVDGRPCGHWLRKNKRESRPIDISCLHQKLNEKAARDNPLFTMCFGASPEGYCRCKDEHQRALGDWSCESAPDGEDFFHSCDRSPYERSFYAYSPGPVMITGWPINRTHTFPHSLYILRHDLEECGFADKYHFHEKHEHSHWKDDDFFMRVGTFLAPVPAEQLVATQKGVRDCLSRMKPVVFDVNVDDISIVLYKETSLGEQDILKRIELADFLKDPSTVAASYR